MPDNYKEIDPRGIDTAVKDFPKESLTGEQTPIEALRPGTTLHAKVLGNLLGKIKDSEIEMAKFYSRWTHNERRMQAYINLPDYEKLIKAQNDEGAPAKTISIVVPHVFATVQTVVTFLMHVVTSRRPMFQVNSKKAETTEAAQMMETLLQYNADHNRMVKKLHQLFMDGEIYGLGVMATRWEETRAIRTVWRKEEQGFGFGSLRIGGQAAHAVEEERIIYQGNTVENIDPTCFFPDPSVPMTEVNKEGEYVFTRSYKGTHYLKTKEQQGVFKWVDAAGQGNHDLHGDRGLRAGGVSHAGSDTRRTKVNQLDEGTIHIIPKEWGLGESTEIQMWLFTIANKTQIIRAEPIRYDHNMHPIVVTEPYSFGYSFGNLGLSDFIGPMQDLLSWFINSHVANVRSSINNNWVVDPSRVEMADVLSDKAGKVIRLKRAAYGQEVKNAIQQLPVQDVTKGHINDMAVVQRIADSLSAVTDNLRGLQSSGGRKTATEVRISGEAGSSRLAKHVSMISAQGLTDLTEQMTINIQQWQTEEMYLQIVGDEGVKTPMRIGPEQVVGDFFFPIHDGTVPLDRVAMLDIWREILQGVGADPELRQTYSLTQIFEFVAELGGAKNISNFKIDVQAPEDIAANSNLIPLDQLPQPGGATGTSNSLPSNPGDRIAGAL